MPVILAEVTLAPLADLIGQIQAGMTWLFGRFTTVVNTITSNDLLLYPVIFALVSSGVALVIRIVRKFGMKSRRS